MFKKQVIKTDNKEDNLKVQEILGQLGYTWRGGQIIPWVAGMNNFLITYPDGCICFAERSLHHDVEEVPAKDFISANTFTFKELKIKTTNQEENFQVQRRLGEMGYVWINNQEIPWSGGVNNYLTTSKKGKIYHSNGEPSCCYNNYLHLSAEEFLKDLKKKENFYIYTPTMEIMQSVQRRLFDLGYLKPKGIYGLGKLDAPYTYHYNYILYSFDGFTPGMNAINRNVSSVGVFPKEVSLKELFSEDFPRFIAEPEEIIIPLTETKIAKDKIPELVKEVRDLMRKVWPSIKVPNYGDKYIEEKIRLHFEYLGYNYFAGEIISLGSKFPPSSSVLKELDLKDFFDIDKDRVEKTIFNGTQIIVGHDIISFDGHCITYESFETWACRAHL